MDKTPSFSKTRIAPTPSGYLHLGNVLSFALTAALARQTGAGILLRIDDLDRERVSKDYVEDIFDTLSFLGIPWDEGPRNPGEYEREYTQLCRMDLYREALSQLRTEEKLFACTCSRAQVLRDSPDGGYAGTCRDKGIPLDSEGCSWRIRTEMAGEIGIKGVAGVIGGKVSAGGNGVMGIAGVIGGNDIQGTAGGEEINALLPVEMTDFVVRKRDGFPAYQLTSVIDDLHYGIDLVVRGEDLWDSTLAQLWLAHELGREAFGQIHFYHHMLLMEGESDAPTERTGDGPMRTGSPPMRAGGVKLSKSAGATSVRYLRGKGVRPAELYAMIVRMLGMNFQAGSWEELATGVI